MIHVQGQNPLLCVNVNTCMLFCDTQHVYYSENVDNFHYPYWGASKELRGFATRATTSRLHDHRLTEFFIHCQLRPQYELSPQIGARWYQAPLQSSLVCRRLVYDYDKTYRISPIHRDTSYTIEIDIGACLCVILATRLGYFLPHRTVVVDENILENRTTVETHSTWATVTLERTWTFVLLCTKCFIFSFKKRKSQPIFKNVETQTRHVCIYLNAFLMAIPNMVMKFNNY